MQKQGEKLSYSRLVSRTKYYQDKALELEKKLFFAEEKLKSLEDELEQKSIESEDYTKLKSNYDESQALLQEKEEKYSKLIDEYHTELEQKDEENKKLAKDLEQLKSGRDESGSELQRYKKQINSFESLLKEVQTELNEKEQQLEVYKNRLKNLEKRKGTGYQQPPEVTKESKVEKGTSVLSFFDYSMILDEDKSCIIRGNFHIENVGDEALTNPFVCFRFYPLDAATIKGKIIDIQQAEQTDDQTSVKWVYVDDQWGQDAKERGEIWVRPYGQVRLAAEERISLHDLQIPIRKHFDDKVIVEGFVYFQKENYKAKASNQILITF